jgi:hypothetical protein
VDDHPAQADRSLTLIMIELVRLLIEKGALNPNQFQTAISEAVVRAIEGGASSGFENIAVELIEKIENWKANPKLTPVGEEQQPTSNYTHQLWNTLQNSGLYRSAPSRKAERPTMNKISHLKARVQEFDEMARIEKSDEGRKFYRRLEMEFEERLAIEAGILSPDTNPCGAFGFR